MEKLCVALDSEAATLIAFHVTTTIPTWKIIVMTFVSVIRLYKIRLNMTRVPANITIDADLEI